MKHKLYSLTIIPVFFIALSACSNYKDPSEVKFTFTDLDAVEIHSDFQKEYLNSEDKDSFVSTHSDELSSFSNSSPNKIKITYSIESDSGVSPTKESVRVSELDNMSNYMEFIGKDGEAYIYNMKTATTYYYQVVGHYVSDFTSVVKTFTTSNEPLRNIEIEGVENCRDLGGWNIGENKTYKQGILFRTAQFNYGGIYNTYVSEPTEIGKKVLLDDLKIKTEIDLRKTIEANNGYDEVNSITSSPLGSSVKYVSCPMVFGGKDIFTQSANKESLKLFFETLSDANNYPIAFHCLRGTDRTGALAYIIGAIAGMNEDDLMTDYLFSNFGNIGSAVRRSSISSLYVRGISLAEGETYQEKAANYLMTNVDVSIDTISAIRNILVA